mmetsp:Transcript_11255/g.12886  ORF Transcript_11255/g.12886 Transcript_11255/m.12886 type:complete len:144 (-) Transcript_11255:321-752(-)|eukprot:CAMPEP_0194130808 /NCGR_PEP_ID=MMETSP0152-20130528/1752_1 /TAXON_ID=1049557 /ORGANISM="Thalassiothrix antarctica, Strain L6-D1" /LENGTH=143 /DNA_ID=CAMNT_0038825423 /DNA_START=65 /DNA_END=496 /DNA_ORIENTATION=+
MPEDKQQQPQNMFEYDTRNNYAWLVSFGAMMVPFTAFVYGHSRGLTVRVIESVARSPMGVGGLLLLPFITLGMEKCVYDTTQSFQGINPNIKPADRGGFPSGGADLPSFSLVPVSERNPLDYFLGSPSIRRRLTSHPIKDRVE